MRPLLMAAAVIGAASAFAMTEVMAQCSRTSIPLPDPILLTPSPEFSCAFTIASQNDATRQPGAARDPAAEAAAVNTNLDYERQCYRQARAFSHDRLRQLQASVGEMVKAANRACPAAVSTSGPGSRPVIPLPHQALLTPLPEVDCTFKASPDAVGGAPSPTPAQAAAALRMKLDYERQCYRHNEIILLNGLRQLQDAVWETVKALNRDERPAAAAARGKPAARQQPAAVARPIATQGSAAIEQRAAVAQQPNGRRPSGANANRANANKEAPCAALSSHARCIGRDPDPRVRFMLSHDSGSD